MSNGPWGRPQQPYGQQPGWGPQGPQGGYPGYPPAGGPGGPRRHSTGMILGIVAGAVAFLVIVGIIIGTLANNSSAAASAPIHPGTGMPTAQAPQPQPGEPSSTSSAGGPDTGGTSGTISFGTCKLKPSHGWHKKTVKASDGLATVVDSDGDVFQAQCVQLDKGTDPQQVLNTWFDQLSKDCTDTKTQAAKPVDTGADDLTAAQAQMQCSTSDSQGSTVLGMASAVAVRDDGMTALTTLIYGESSNVDRIGTDYSKMTVSVWSSLE